MTAGAAEVRPLTPEDERTYRELGGSGELPAFVAECDGLLAYGNDLDEVLAGIRQGLADRRAMLGVVLAA